MAKYSNGEKTLIEYNDKIRKRRRRRRRRRKRRRKI